MVEQYILVKITVTTEMPMLMFILYWPQSLRDVAYLAKYTSTAPADADAPVSIDTTLALYSGKPPRKYSMRKFRGRLLGEKIAWSQKARTEKLSLILLLD